MRIQAVTSTGLAAQNGGTVCQMRESVECSAQGAIGTAPMGNAHSTGFIVKVMSGALFWPMSGGPDLDIGEVISVIVPPIQRRHWRPCICVWARAA